MSSEIAVRVNNLSKCYHIYDRPPDRLKQSTLPRLQRLIRRPPRQYYREFWALKNVSFEVKKGETVGIIGRNGSGKSTLLQIICGTLAPTSGNVETNGRVAALLELGSGFNPEFTGRENVYMNGAVLGLSQNEIAARFDDISAFADIAGFIDQPVKTYSSGMLLRLAFSVIAHVDAEVLVIDEALSVGDAVFTQKCMRFLRRFIQTGTVVFVSHDTAAVINLCQNAVWLRRGQIEFKGDAKTVTQSYMRSNLEEIYGGEVELKAVVSDGTTSEETLLENNANVDPQTRFELFDALRTSTGWNTGGAEIDWIGFVDGQGNRLASLMGGEKVRLVVRARANRELFSPIIGFFVKDRLGQCLFGEHTFTYVEHPLAAGAHERLEANFNFVLPLLPNGDYSITVSIAEGTPEEHVQHHWVHDAIIFRVCSDKLRYGLVGIPFQRVSLERLG